MKNFGYRSVYSFWDILVVLGISDTCVRLRETESAPPPKSIDCDDRSGHNKRIFILVPFSPLSTHDAGKILTLLYLESHRVRRTSVLRQSVCLLAAAIGSLQLHASPANGEDLRFRIQPLVIDANEGIAAGDIDGDGKTDLVSGRSWYRSPDFVARPLRSIADWNGYVESNGDFLFDVNGDSRLDVIAGSFLPTKVFWYENPGDEALRLGKQWKENLLVDTGDTCNEGQLLEDIDGDGRPEWVVNSWKKGVPTRIWRLVDCPPDASGAIIKLEPVTLGETANGHGIAVGDISGDGKLDVLVGEGWYEQPAIDPWAGKWTFHSDWDLQSSLPMLVTDLDKDGKKDLVYGNGHDYGLYWWKNLGPDGSGKIAWKEHLIDRGYSQPHVLLMKDLDGDGSEELITGKRYFAHNGGDPGGMELPCLYYYTWDAKGLEFTRHKLDEGRVGCGLQIVAHDLNGDQKADIAVAGKSGTYVLLQE